ncbi:MAG: hypothetical protein A3C90_00275 [Candidatus Magasanikbacteria bacterium RIFCSPHIGHO2_02_FULL_51_14]|uniref:UDP-N-acetylglucosamine 2-epimerase domain-containing protein n=1 Tax=Candidatus Magasanikbacteria bacterium RIFCSPHIGHO2_02_FULL_51_14 TaxID=1798683 RepID=A0A1F6MDA7_9BACT|nr:MAG: hypothetical protein A3C90_00275 [Candidatus Magasanikbacteria bacterium RIFCSPHIGHO2_02_FULL_51_14]
MAKPKIFFIPTYIGPLKHYERLIPYLKEKYDVGFLIVWPDGHRRQEAIEYCKEKKYECHVIDRGIGRDRRLRLPFITPIQKRREHILACRNFLETVKPAKIISHKAWSPYETIFKEANSKGVETIVLQWSSDAGLLPRDGYRHTLAKRLYLFLLEALFRIFDVFYAEPRYRSTPAVPKKIGVLYEDKAREYREKGYDPRTVHTVGSIDIQLAHELKQKIDSDNFLKTALLKKYGLSQEKLRIVVILHRFYLDPIPYAMTIEEHRNHYDQMFRILRDVFPAEEADIMLKLHPTENAMTDIYEPYKKLGVQVLYGSAKTDELVCLSDLYIGEPASSVNYMAVGCGVPALFVNFSKARFLNEKIRYFSIQHVVGDANEFQEMLRAFRRGALEKQHDASALNFRSLDQTISLITQ